jgi:hypothetical protein
VKWPEEEARFVVARGPYAGQSGKLVKPLGKGDWMVKLDGTMFGRTLKVSDLRPETE